MSRGGAVICSAGKKGGSCWKLHTSLTPASITSHMNLINEKTCDLCPKSGTPQINENPWQKPTNIHQHHQIPSQNPWALTIATGAKQMQHGE